MFVCRLDIRRHLLFVGNINYHNPYPDPHLSKASHLQSILLALLILDIFLSQTYFFSYLIPIYF